ncbi:MAG: peptidoglycan DD-metalloendopeptidase family protein [Alicyclobacillus sp.]|nr:peptidoglycan DD-metalloendopeptidase family protein [Alicyclobacillus sp.]
MQSTTGDPRRAWRPVSREWAVQAGRHLRTLWMQWGSYWQEQWRQTPRLRTTLAALAGVGVLAVGTGVAVGHVRQTASWVRVYNSGSYVGMVPAEAASGVQRLAEGFRVPVQLQPVHLHVAAGYDWQRVAALPTPAAGIVINGRPVAYTATLAAAEQALAQVRAALLPKNLPADANVHFTQPVVIEPAEISVSRILSAEAAAGLLLGRGKSPLAGRAGTALGDTHQADASPAAAPGVATDAQAAGRPRGGGGPLLGVEAEAVVTREVSLPYTIQYQNDSQLPQGQVQVIRPGQAGRAVEQVRETFRNGSLVQSTVVSRTVEQPPQAEVAKRGTNTGVASGSWLWPCAAYDITSGFGWRNLSGTGDFHPGVDIGCPVGTPVYATNNGVVEDAGWNSGGYGIWVKIDNGNGLETVFGHLSRAAVQPGQRVAKGQLIGYSGQTGMATGPHLHYEVRLNGQPINPRPYM